MPEGNSGPRLILRSSWEINIHPMFRLFGLYIYLCFCLIILPICSSVFPLIIQTVGATVEGQQYLLTKAMLQKSIALNAVIYFLLKSQAIFNDDGTDSIKAHPITDQLKALYMALEKLKEKVESKVTGLDQQIDTLVKAVALMNSGITDDHHHSSKSGFDDNAVAVNEEDVDHVRIERGLGIATEIEGSSNSEEDRTALASIVDQNDHNRTLNEARFGLRPEEAKKSSKASKRRSSNYMNDFGDLDEGRSDPKRLASSINSIEQRSQVALKKRRPTPIEEQLDDLEEHDDRLAQGIKMMEEELGKLDDVDEVDDVSGSVNFQGMDDPDNYDESQEFYETMKKKVKSKKSLKSSLYEVAPKFPRGDTLVDGERAISRTILKNRGLVAHKAKINRNPRVKKKEQFRKALIRRKGSVREVREGEGHKYGGEGTGIKSGISRSRKLTSK
jgi:U3 small nucleolar RNA-associated protein 3